MRGKARARFLVVLLVLLGAVPAVALAAGAHVTVRPKSGGPNTRFTVRFTAPDTSGHVGAMQRSYVVTAAGPRAAKHCLDSATESPGHVKAHARVRVTLSPGAMNGHWCTGAWAGTVEEISSPVCSPHQICPLFAVLVRRIGHFHFKVLRSVHG